jgi:hypothetical protein
MKISKRTMAVLENFQRINPQILLIPGTRISTMTDDSPGSSSSGGKIIAFAEVSDEFPMEFGIHDLGTFISTIKMMAKSESDVDLEFEENYVDIRSEGLNMTYYRTPTTLISATPRDMVFPGVAEFEFDLDIEKFEKLDKISSVNNLPYLRVEGDGDKIWFLGFGEDTDNTLKMQVADYVGPEFETTLVWSHLKMMRANYKVGVKPGSFLRFTERTSGWIDYVVAVKDV